MHQTNLKKRVGLFFALSLLTSPYSIADNQHRHDRNIDARGHNVQTGQIRHHIRNLPEARVEYQGHGQQPNEHVHHGRYFHDGQHYNYYNHGHYYNYYHNGAYFVYLINGMYYNYFFNGQYYVYQVNGHYYNHYNHGRYY